MNWDAKPPKDINCAMKAIRSHREVGRIMGISRSTVFYIEKSALNKIYKRMRLIEKRGECGCE